MTEPQSHEKKTKILLLGASGYIGGSVLNSLIQQNASEKYTLTALVRKAYQASILKDAGVTPLIFESLDDFETIKEAAGGADVVISAANARHRGAAQACLVGLGERRKMMGKETYYLHISGASTIGDFPVTGDRIDEKTYSDVDDDVYELEKNWPEQHSPVRKVNQFVVEKGLEVGVKTIIVPAPLIWGPGTGSFSLGYGQIHQLVQLSIKKKQAVMLGHGSGIWTRIHIQDLSDLFMRLVNAILEQNPDLPTGKQGYFFADNGTQSWRSISERIAKIGTTAGVFETEDVAEVEVKEAADEFKMGLRDMEGILGSNARTKGDKARKLFGWEPKHGEDEFWEEIDDVASTMFAQEK